MSGAFISRSAMHLMTGQALDLAFEQGEWGVGWVRGDIINRMMIFFVVMTVETRCRGLGARGK